MYCIILAAGYATRLYPLTLNTPKPLLPVGGRPMVEHIVENMERVSAVSDIIIVTNDKFYEPFLEWAASFRSAKHTTKKITVLNDGTKTNEDRLGAIGDIDFTIKKLNIKDDLMVIAGDNLFEFSLADFYAFFKKKQSTVLAVYDLGDPAKLSKKFGTVQTDKNSRVISFEEKPEHPKSSLAATACYIFTKEDVAELRRCIEENKKPDNSGDFIGWLAMKKPVYAYRFLGKWFDIGSKEQYEEVNRLYNSGQSR